MTRTKAKAKATDRSHQRHQLQRLAIAAGMTLRDGSPIVVDGPKCPPIHKIKAAIGFTANRMTRDQYSDARDDYGAERPYFAPDHEAGIDADAILKEWSGFSDCDGEMSLEHLLQIS